MPPYDNCPNCFMPTGESSVCPYCGNESSMNKKYLGVLKPFSLLNNRYLVGRVLGKGGFGVTYIAKDFVRNSICAIKEYMPSEYSTRSQDTKSIVPFSDDKAKYVFSHGREKFIEEARTLLKLIYNPVVVDILDYFEENNTAYLVMEYLDGQNLRDIAKGNGGKMDYETVRLVFVTVASALMEIHRKNILHRDLSPDNIIITKENRIKLIDFGAARNFVSTQNKGMSILLKPGFAPPEQYNAKGSQGPWSDVYALCATFYTLLSGKRLVDALFRYRGEVQPSLYSLGCHISKNMSDVIERGMELDYRRRYKDFKELLDDIDDMSQSKGANMLKTSSKSSLSASYANVSQPTQSNAMINMSGIPGGAPPVQVLSEIASRPYVAAVIGNTICNKVLITTKDIFKIGRSAQSCQYVISGDTNISRIHCFLRFDGKRIFIQDSSANGTYLEDGKHLVKNKEYVLNPGTKFYLATNDHMLVVDFSIER